MCIDWNNILLLLRLNQYIKNVFIFLPLFFGLKLTDPNLFLKATIAFIAFSLISSAVYIFNDFHDIRRFSMIFLILVIFYDFGMIFKGFPWSGHPRTTNYIIGLHKILWFSTIPDAPRGRTSSFWIEFHQISMILMILGGGHIIRWDSFLVKSFCSDIEFSP